MASLSGCSHLSNESLSDCEAGHRIDGAAPSGPPQAAERIAPAAPAAVRLIRVTSSQLYSQDRQTMAMAKNALTVRAFSWSLSQCLGHMVSIGVRGGVSGFNRALARPQTISLRRSVD